MKGSTIRKILICFFSALLIFSGANVAVILNGYNKSDNVYEALQSSFVISQPDELTYPEDVAKDTSDEFSAPEQSAHLPIEIDFDELLKENADIKGWLYCPDTKLNYPVVQGKDNQQYLRRDLKGNYIISGTIFVDYRNEEPGMDNNYIIYGHNMRNDSVFSMVAKYKDEAYYKKHPIIYYLTPTENYIISLFSGKVVKRDSPIYNPDIDKTELLAFAKSRSTFTSDVQVGEDDIVFTLSTCSYEFEDARYIIMGKAEKI